MNLSKITNKLAELAERKVVDITCIGWINAPKPPAELMSLKKDKK